MFNEVHHDRATLIYVRQKIIDTRDYLNRYRYMQSSAMTGYDNLIEELTVEIDKLAKMDGNCV